MIRILLAFSFGLLLAACGADGDPITPVSSAAVAPSALFGMETGIADAGLNYLRANS